MRIRTPAEIYEDYEAEVLSLLPELESWWASIAGIEYNGTSRDERWPTGMCAHPRYIAVFRKYFIEILRQNEVIEEMIAKSEGDIVEEEQWGTEQFEKDLEHETIRPQGLLLEDLLLRQKHLRERFKFFVYMPIGSDD